MLWLKIAVHRFRPQTHTALSNIPLGRNNHNVEASFLGQIFYTKNNNAHEWDLL